MAERRWSRHVHVQRGKLSHYGYCVKCSARSRHIALRKAARHLGASEVSREVNFLANVTSREHPTLKAKYRADQRWVERELEHDGREDRRE